MTSLWQVKKNPAAPMGTPSRMKKKKERKRSFRVPRTFYVTLLRDGRDNYDRKEMRIKLLSQSCA